jgi:hypothetical protein
MPTPFFTNLPKKQHTSSTPTPTKLVRVQLILARATIKAFVRNPAATASAYGPYVKPVACEASADMKTLRAALRGAGSVVCLGQVAQLAKVGDS